MIIIFCDVSRATAAAAAVVERWCEGNVCKQRDHQPLALRADSSLIVKTSPDSTAQKKTSTRDTGSYLLCSFRAFFNLKRVTVSACAVHRKNVDIRTVKTGLLSSFCHSVSS